MKVKIISKSDALGGAFRAAFRLHNALRAHDIDSNMLVRKRRSDSWTIRAPEGYMNAALDLIRMPIAKRINVLQRTANTGVHSSNFLPSNFSKRLNNSDADVINLHWVGDETLSIEDIGRIKKPVVWTLHDMWAFCGAEHVTRYDETARWRHGYTHSNRPTTEQGLDLNKWVWNRKHKSWQNKMHIVAPSRWLANCASTSKLFNNFPIVTIPNPLDTDVYQLLDAGFCRHALGLPQDKKIIVFGAIGGSKDPNKGFDLLTEALKYLAEQIVPEQLLCVFFGQSEPQHLLNFPFRALWLGHIYDDVTLALLYNSASAVIVPSRQENLPQLATEAQSCGCPVVAFNSSGLPDAVIHRQTGYLAQAYDPLDMALGIKWVLKDEVRRIVGSAARARAITLWSYKAVASQYIDVYQQAIDYQKVFL